MSPSVNSNSDPAAATATQTSEGPPTERGVSPPGVPSLQQQGQLKQQSQLFRDLMAGRMTAWQLAELAAQMDSATPAAVPALHTHDQQQQSGFGEDPRHTNVDVAAFLAADRRIDAGPPPQTIAAAATPDRTFAELVEKHVRRVLASREARGTHGGEVRIELSDAALPGTALLLKRTPMGWHLSASSDNDRSLEQLEQFGPALVERFARASLGHLEVAVVRS